MRESAMIRVASSTRTALRALAESDGLTLDEELAQLARAERQRRIGAALAGPASDSDETWLDMTAPDVAEHARR